VNAACQFAARLPADTVRRLARAPGLDVEEARSRVVARWVADLCGLLNAMTCGELAALARHVGVATDGKSPELRARLWEHGAGIERGDAEVSRGLQPRPVVLGGHLVVQGAPRGLYPPSQGWPRPVPPPRAAAAPADEPDSVDELLAAADRAIGVRLGRRGVDKGAWGNRAARLLGVIERGDGEPDWRGDVEVKTVPIARDPSGLWRIAEDPAISMLGEARPVAKLQRTLWLPRASLSEGDATIVSWYLLGWDAEVARLAHRDLHARPKGPAGTSQRGLYLKKRFFADAGLLATLNGP
jgi:hypothetical protein